MAICGLIGVFGPALNLSQAVLDISPFPHVPKLPGGAITVTPLLWLAGFSLVLTPPGWPACDAGTSADEPAP